MGLAGKTILVTGGTGSIGRSICLEAASQGADIAFSFHKNEDGARDLASRIATIGRKYHYAQVNIPAAADIEGFVSEVENQFGKIDILVNNLGKVQAMPFALMDEEDWDDIITVNLKGLFLFSKAVLRGMIRNKSGSIVNLGSIAGHRMVEVPVHYATAKAGVVGFTTSLAREVCRYGIRVNAVAPGLIEGGIGDNVSERQLEEYNRFCSLGRPGTPEEVAKLVTFIASSESSYMNGQTVVLDGGL